MGHPLQRELTGLWAARRGTYRVIYEILDADTDPPSTADSEGTVRVIEIEHRRDAYRRR